MTTKKSESRFGFGQLAATFGAVLVAVGTTQPWLRVDPATAFVQALKPGRLEPDVANQVLFVFGSPAEQVKGTPAAARVSELLGVTDTGWEQNQYLAIALVAAAALAVVAVVRSVLASSAWGARRQSPLLALTGLASLGCAAAALWLLAPEPRQAMRPEVGLWLVAGGGALLLLGALTLGNNRRRPWIDELTDHQPMKAFDNTEHLAYSHGAWVPRLPDDH